MFCKIVSDGMRDSIVAMAEHNSSKAMMFELPADAILLDMPDGCYEVLLTSPTVIQGIPCSENIREVCGFLFPLSKKLRTFLHGNGMIQRTAISEPMIIGGRNVPTGTVLKCEEDGSLSSVQLPSGSSAHIPIRLGRDTVHSLSVQLRNGSLFRIRLARSIQVGSFMANAGSSVTFHPNGKLRSCTYAREFQCTLIDSEQTEIVIPPDARYNFDIEGQLISIKPSRELAIKGIAFKKHDLITFYTNGDIVGTSARNIQGGTTDLIKRGQVFTFNIHTGEIFLGKRAQTIALE